MAKKSTGNIARDGAPKKVQTDAPANPGMRHVATADDGSKIHAKGISRTQAQQLLANDGGLGAVNSGGQPKRTQTETPPHPSADPFNSDRGEHIAGQGARVLDEAVISGSHLPRKATPADCPPTKK